MSISRIGANIQAMQALESFARINERIGVHQLRLATYLKIKEQTVYRLVQQKSNHE